MMDKTELELLKVNYNNLHESTWNNHRFAWIVVSISIPVLFAMLGFLVKEYDDISKSKTFSHNFPICPGRLIEMLINAVFLDSRLRGNPVIETRTSREFTSFMAIND